MSSDINCLKLVKANSTMRDWIKQPLCIKCFFFVIVVDQTEREIRWTIPRYDFYLSKQTCFWFQRPPRGISWMGGLRHSASKASFRRSEGCGRLPPTGRWGCGAQTSTRRCTSEKNLINISKTRLRNGGWECRGSTVSPFVSDSIWAQGWVGRGYNRYPLKFSSISSKPNKFLIERLKEILRSLRV